MRSGRARLLAHGAADNRLARAVPQHSRWPHLAPRALARRNTPENRELTAEIMFETFNVKGLYIAAGGPRARRIVDVEASG